MTPRRTINLFARGLGSGLPIVAPTRIQLWAPGPVRGDFPTNQWDAEAARSVMANYMERAGGNASMAFIPLDIEHATNPKVNPLYDPAKPPPGGGYAGLKLDERGALWLDPIEWSAYARNEIESGSRRAISPDWIFDPETGRPVRLNKVSLVQNPGTYGIGLVASAGANGGNTQMDPIKLLLASLKAANVGDAENPAITALIAEFEKAMAEGTGAPAADAMPMDAAATDCAPGDKKPDMAAMAAMAAATLAAAKGAKTATASAPAGERALTAKEVIALVAQTHRQEKDKDALIASAAQSPGMTPALETQLRGLPLATVKGIVGALPPPAPKGTEEAQASADTKTQQAKQTGVKREALPGHEAKSATASASSASDTDAEGLTAQEKHDIALIEQAAMNDEQRLKAFEDQRALLAGAGIGLFSGTSKVRQAQEALFGKAN